MLDVVNARTPQDVAIAGRALAWLTVMAALAWYAAKLPSSSDAALAAAVAVGLGVGFRITRRGSLWPCCR